jgi:hypothetical protein
VLHCAGKGNSKVKAEEEEHAKNQNEEEGGESDDGEIEGSDEENHEKGLSCNPSLPWSPCFVHNCLFSITAPPSSVFILCMYIHPAVRCLIQKHASERQVEVDRIGTRPRPTHST